MKSKIINYELYDYIITNYVKADNPVTQKEIADTFKMNIGAVKNFMFRHKLNKKSYYAERNEKIKKLYNAGIDAKTISKVTDVTLQNIYNILD